MPSDALGCPRTPGRADTKEGRSSDIGRSVTWVRYPIGASATVEELTADPHPLLARLRAAEPVSWLPALGGWLVTCHALARQVMRERGRLHRR